MADQCTITHDPLGLFYAGAEIASRESEAREHGEDILQLEVRRRDGLRVVDVRWYRDRYVVVEVENRAWDAPTLKVDCKNLVEAITQVRKLVG